MLVNQPAGEVTLSMKFHVIGDSSPPNTLLKQEGLQLAEAFTAHKVFHCLTSESLSRPLKLPSMARLKLGFEFLA